MRRLFYNGRILAEEGTFERGYVVTAAMPPRSGPGYYYVVIVLKLQRINGRQ